MSIIAQNKICKKKTSKFSHNQTFLSGMDSLIEKFSKIFSLKTRRGNCLLLYHSNDAFEGPTRRIVERI